MVGPPAPVFSALGVSCRRCDPCATCSSEMSSSCDTPQHAGPAGAAWNGWRALATIAHATPGLTISGMLRMERVSVQPV